MAESGLEIHFYTNQPDTNYCRKLESLHKGIHYEGYKGYNELLCELTRYDVGLLVFHLTNKNFKQLFVGSPNKMYDYLLAGLPVAASDLKHCISFLETCHAGGSIRWDGDIRAQVQ